VGIDPAKTAAIEATSGNEREDFIVRNENRLPHGTVCE
jgi:hypothetical protein